MKRLVCVLMICFGLVSCSTTLNKRHSTCDIDFWDQEGRKDALNGYSMNRFEERVKGCFFLDKNRAFTLYNIGYQQGYDNYCTDKNGYIVGLYNRSYSGICDSDDTVFLSAYQQGLQVYQVNKKVTQAMVSYQKITQQIQEEEIKQQLLLSQNSAAKGTSSGFIFLKELAVSKNYLNELMDEIYFLDKVLQKYQWDLEQVKKH